MTGIRVGSSGSVSQKGTLRPSGTYAGTFNPSSGLPTTGTGRNGMILKGDFWKATGAGTIASLEPFTVFAAGDLIYANTNNATVVGDFLGNKGSGITDVIAGTNISIDKSDPLNPVISTTDVRTVVTATSTSTLTVNSDTTYQSCLTAQAEALTIANPTGTPFNGQDLVVRVKDNGTARAITFGSQFRAIGTALPTTTTISKVLYICGLWNAAESKWDTVNHLEV